MNLFSMLCPHSDFVVTFYVSISSFSVVGAVMPREKRLMSLISSVNFGADAVDPCAHSEERLKLPSGRHTFVINLALVLVFPILSRTAKRFLL